MAITPSKTSLLLIEDLASSKFRDEKSGKYRSRLKPIDHYRHFLRDIFQPARSLQRAASFTSLTFDRDKQNLYLPRSTSYSTLSPSHGLDYSDRVATRYIPHYSAYRTRPPSWYEEARRESQRDYHHWRKHKIYELPEQRSKLDYRRQLGYNSHFPVQWSRLERLYGYHSGEINAWRTMLPLSYPNYDRRDDRDYMKYLTCRALRGPYYGRRIAGEREVLRPYRLVLVAPL